MPELSVVVISQDDDLRTMLQMLVDSSTMARTVHAASSLPVSAADPAARRVREAAPDVVLIDIPGSNPSPSLRALELLHTDMPGLSIFGVGEMSQPQVIVNAMRAGAREFLERPPSPAALLEALVRVASAQRKTQKNTERGKVYSILNAKGGCGATTIAVNLALSLQAEKGRVALLDLAQLGHCALHLNVRPSFTVGEALKNLHRLDGSLLESFMTRHPSGLHLLAGASEPVLVQPQSADFARMFDLLVQHYDFIVVDASSRLDATVRVIADLSDAVMIIANADVPALWSASRITQFVSGGGNTDRVHLILNRFRKIPGFKDTDAEAATGSKLLAKLVDYSGVQAAIDRGVPVVEQNHSEIARGFRELTHSLLSPGDGADRRSWSIFKTA